MLSVSSLNIISSRETSFSSLARGSSRCWESSKSFYLLRHTPLLPASRRDKEPRSPGESSPSAGTRQQQQRREAGASARGRRWPRDGVWVSQAFYQGGISLTKVPSLPAVPRRDFLPTSQDGGQQAQPAALGQAGSGLGRLQPSGRRLHDPGHLPGKVCQGLPISHLVPWVRRDGQEQRDAPWGDTGSSHWLQGHNLGKREGAGQPLPLPQKRKANSGRSEGLVVCGAGGWDKMAAAKSSPKRPKLLMRMKPRQHPFAPRRAQRHKHLLSPIQPEPRAAV